MTRIPGIKRVFTRERVGDTAHEELDDELAFHFDMTIEELVRGGMTREAAGAEALRRFGDVTRHRRALEAIDRARAAQARRAEWWRGLAQDLRFALRGLRNNPGFTVAAVLTLALGIGANAAMFGVVDRLLLAAPAYVQEPERVALLYFRTKWRNGVEGLGDATSYPKYVAMRDGTRSFEAIGAFSSREATLGFGPDARPIHVTMASGELFALLGVRPVLGRMFTAADERSGERVAVISHAIWQGTFAGDEGVIGRAISIGREQFTVVGVAPPRFTGLRLTRTDVWLPLAVAAPVVFTPQWNERGWFYLTTVGRLRPGVTREQAAVELTAALDRDSQESGDDRRSSVIASSVIQNRGPQRSREATIAIWLAGVSVVVLLIACANIANLLLARALRRRREIAVRLALGAGRGRLVRLLLAESLLLALLGAAGALALAQWGGEGMRTLLLPGSAAEGSPLGARMLWFTAIAALATSFFAGIVPAIQASRPDLMVALKAGSREGVGLRWRTRRALLLAQAALSVVLLIGAGLFVRSLHNVRTVDLGFDADRVVVVQIDFGKLGGLASNQDALYAQLLERVRAMPGVERAALGMTTPFRTTIVSDLVVPGLDSVPRQNGMLPFINAVGPDFFATMGTRIIRGRPITLSDRVGTERVAVVSETMARRLWPGEDAIGKCLKVDADTVPCSTVVGVAESARHQSVREDPPMQYWVALEQGVAPTSLRALFVRASGDPADLIEPIQRETAALGTDVPRAEVTVLGSLTDSEVRPWKLGATMFVIFGVLALLVAAVGLYSVIAYNVAQRTHELGVRLALGATGKEIISLVMREGLGVALAGVLLGAAVSVWAGRFAQPLLFDVDARDPVVYAIVTSTLLVVAALASAVPAVRASRVSAGSALRVE